VKTCATEVPFVISMDNALVPLRDSPMRPAEWRPRDATISVMPHPIESSHLKIERANQHIAAIRAIVLTLADAYIATVEINPDGGNEVVKHDLRNRDKIISDIALMLGDAIHNLHCALDHAWIAALTRLSPQSINRHTKFPVFVSRDKVEGALRSVKVDVTAPSLFNTVLNGICPYEGGNDSIWDIHRLDIDDKHILLLPVVEFASIKGIKVENEQGDSENAFTWATTQNPPYYVPIPVGWHFKEKGQVTFSLTFGEGIPTHGMEVLDMLSVFAFRVLTVVQLLENEISN